jgi:hypothetical protein
MITSQLREALGTPWVPPPQPPPPAGDIAMTLDALPVLYTYPAQGGLVLCSLAALSVYRCACCAACRDWALVAVSADRELLCPACFATLSHAAMQATAGRQSHDRKAH